MLRMRVGVACSVYLAATVGPGGSQVGDIRCKLVAIGGRRTPLCGGNSRRAAAVCDASPQC